MNMVAFVMCCLSEFWRGASVLVQSVIHLWSSLAAELASGVVGGGVWLRVQARCFSVILLQFLRGGMALDCARWVLRRRSGRSGGPSRGVAWCD